MISKVDEGGVNKGRHFFILLLYFLSLGVTFGWLGFVGPLNGRFVLAFLALLSFSLFGGGLYFFVRFVTLVLCFFFISNELIGLLLAVFICAWYFPDFMLRGGVMAAFLFLFLKETKYGFYFSETSAVFLSHVSSFLVRDKVDFGSTFLGLHCYIVVFAHLIFFKRPIIKRLCFFSLLSAIFSLIILRFLAPSEIIDLALKVDYMEDDHTPWYLMAAGGERVLILPLFLFAVNLISYFMVVKLNDLRNESS